MRGGIYGTAPNLSLDPANPTLENNAGDVKYETDFRSVYAQILDTWLGATRCRFSARTSAPARRRSSRRQPEGNRQTKTQDSRLKRSIDLAASSLSPKPQRRLLLP